MPKRFPLEGTRSFELFEPIEPFARSGHAGVHA